MIDFFPSRQVALSIGSFSIHWYGVMYALAFLIGAFLLPRLSAITRLRLQGRAADDLLIAAFLGVLLGGRLGFVFLYGGTYYFGHPWEIIAVWKGGMSSHGGFLGVTLGLFWFCRKYKVSFLTLTDTIVVPVAIGLMLGRLGNLINGELYGTVTTLPWGMHFPGAEGLRHPTQIYAMLKDLFLALLCFSALKHVYRHEHPRSGVVAGFFLGVYAVLRFVVEIFRDQPYGYTEILGIELSRGQLLTIPLFFVAMAVLFFTSRRKTS